MIMEYSSLENTFLDFCKIAIDYMKSNSPNGKVEKRKVKKTSFSEKQVKDIEAEEYRHWQYFDIGWEKTLCQHKETLKYIKDQNEVIKREFEYPLYLIITPLLDAVAQKMSFEIDDDFLIETYRKHNAHWISPEHIRLHYIPLLNFKTDEVFKVSEHLDIIEFENSFKSDFAFFYTSPTNSFDLNLYDLWHSHYLIRYKSIWLHGEKEGYGEKPLLALLTSLRLLKRGNVGTKSRLMKSGGPEPHGITGPSGGPVYDFLTFRGSNNYYLESQDIPDVVETFNSIYEIVCSDKYKGLSTSLNRFHLSYTRSHLTDKIVDYSIALESLLLSDDHNELLYRMAIRAAWLLKEVNPPKDIRIKMQVFYEMRSCIVHRGFSIQELLDKHSVRNKLSAFYNDIDKNVLAHFAEDLVKNVILGYIRMLKSESSVKEINNKIDEGIVAW